MKQKAYIVLGVTGEHIDYRTWNVACFKNRVSAFSLCEELNNLLLSNCLHSDCDRDQIEMANWRSYHEKEYFNSEINRLDLNFDIDYTGTEYLVSEIDFIE